MDALEQRAAALETWLRTHAPDCATTQAHTNEGTSERAYWHYGYLMALRDITAWMRARGEPKA